MMAEQVQEALADPKKLPDLAEAALEAAKRVSPYNYFTALDELLPQRAEALAKLGRGGRLFGVIIAVKDNIDVAGLPTTNGAPYAKSLPRTTAPVVKALEAEGALVLGKTNMHELALGVTNLNPHFGPARNPRDPARITGGSSGGSAGAVALGVVPLALATDTGGSIRIPAALCGVVGYKPPYGELPLEGVRPLAPTLDHVGFLTRSAADAAYVASALKSLMLEAPKRFKFAVLEGVGEPDEYVEKAFWAGVSALETAGGEREEVPVDVKAFSSARAAILLAEAASVHWQNLKLHGGEMGR
ncbi:MAG: amidase, partial [Thermoproteus sp.]|nr:amidase [Thermoproteus sp.]